MGSMRRRLLCHGITALTSALVTALVLLSLGATTNTPGDRGNGGRDEGVTAAVVWRDRETAQDARDEGGTSVGGESLDPRSVGRVAGVNTATTDVPYIDTAMSWATRVDEPGTAQTNNAEAAAAPGGRDADDVDERVASATLPPAGAADGGNGNAAAPATDVGDVDAAVDAGVSANLTPAADASSSRGSGDAVAIQAAVAPQASATVPPAASAGENGYPAAATAGATEAVEPTALPTLPPAGAQSFGGNGSAKVLPELRIFFVTIVGTNEPVDLLDLQLRHFSALGIPYRRMGVVMHVSVSPPSKNSTSSTVSPSVTRNIDQVLAIVARYPGVKTRFWRAPFVDNAKVAEMWAMLRDLGFESYPAVRDLTPAPDGPHDWIVYADSDEFHQYVALADPPRPPAVVAPPPADAGTLPTLLAYLSEHNIWGVEGRFLDRVAEGGELRALDLTQSPFVQYPYGCEITHAIVHGTSTKLMAWRPVMIKSGGGGFHEYDRSHPLNHGKRLLAPARGGWVHHFKWVAGIDQEVRRRLADFTARGISYTAEVRNLAYYFERHANRIDVTPEGQPRCSRCTGPGGLVGPDDGDHHLPPLDAATIEQAVMLLQVVTRPPPPTVAS